MAEPAAVCGRGTVVQHEGARAPAWDSHRAVVPFDHAGNMLDYPAWWMDMTWRVLEPFDARMSVVSVERGRSAARFVLEDERGMRYPLFMADMLDLVRTWSVDAGRTPELRWAPVKRGQNYGLRAISTPAGDEEGE